MVKDRKEEGKFPGCSDSPRGNLSEHDDAGVDLSLLRYLLRLSPLERLKLMEKHARDMATLHEYGRKHRETQSRTNR